MNFSSFKNYPFFLLRDFLRFSLTFLFSIFSIVLVFSSASAEERFPYFSDVKSSHPNFFAITELMQGGVINGYADGTFQPDKSVSRAETLKILLLGSKISVDTNQKISFSDVPTDQWFAPYVGKAKDLGIVKGRGGSGKFFPEDTVNKAEALKMLLLVNKKPPQVSDTKSYADVDVESWFAGYFEEAQKRKLFDVSRTEGVNPAQTLTRGDLAEMMYRYRQFDDQNNFSGMILSKGTVTPEKSQNIPADSWEGVTLDEDLNPVFRKGEIFNFEGKISGNADIVSVILTDESGSVAKFSGEVSGGNFSIPVFFETVGKVQIGILLGKSGSYMSYEGEVFGNVLDEEKSEKFSAPENFSAKHYLGKLLLSWDSKGDSKHQLFHIQFRQNEVVKNIFVQGKNSALVPTSVFNNFSTGKIQVFIRSAKTKTSASFPLTTPFSDTKKITFSAFTRFTETLNEDDIKISEATYEYDDTIVIRGKISGNLQTEKAFVLNTKEELFEKKLSFSGSDGSFSLEFSPQKKDFLVIEISDAGGKALAVLPFAPRGMFPILPNDFDKKAETLTKISELDTLRRINTFRKQHNRGVLKSDAVISELALIRAEDMKKRNYFSHTTPAGKTVNDFRIDLGVKVPLSENIAIHSESGLDAAYSLEFSPTHRQNLLDTNISRVGIGMEQKEDGSIILVQLFAGEKITESVLLDLQKKMNNEIQQKNSALQQSTVLQKMTQQWATIMAKKKSDQFEYDSGEKWDDLLTNYKIQRTSNVFIGSFPSQEVLSDFIQNKSEKFADIFSSAKKTFAISLAVSDEGMIFLCMVGEE